MYKTAYVAFFLFASLGLAAQDHHDHIVPLHRNPIVANAAALQQQNKSNKRAQAFSMDTIPFLDGFSKPGPYPDTSLWIDNNVFVNFDMPVCPRTLGVATFDGLNSLGMPYHPGISPYKSDTGDFLTSKPITWRRGFIGQHYGLGDSIYLSFYYQAGTYFGTDAKGRSVLNYTPISSDTLKLQFHANGDTAWHTVWWRLGYQPVADTDTVFHLVMIPFNSLADTSFMRDGFQFRFMAYASCAGADHWSIDEVYLAAGRNYQDTVQGEISFVYNAPQILTNYQAEPWEQYKQSDLRSTGMPIFIRNNNSSAINPPNSSNIINVTYNYNINGTFAYSSGAVNVDPYVDIGYDNSPLQADPALATGSFPATLSAPATYNITHILQRTADFDFWNDTLRYDAIFNNYYAYDNGIPEYAYYVNPIPNVPSFTAYQFDLNNADTIFGMQIYFDYVFINAHSYTFKLILWNDKGGAPGDTIYVDDSLRNPIYANDGNNLLFTTYKFKKPQAIGAGKIYVGWELIQGDSMNVGFEFNDNHQKQIFYSVDLLRTWSTSTYPGSMMVRPLLGSPTGPASVNNMEEPKTDITLYPNPAKNEVYFSAELHNATIRIIGEDGRVLYEDAHFSGNSINTSSLSTGFYFVQITSDKGESIFKKLLISK